MQETLDGIAIYDSPAPVLLVEDNPVNQKIGLLLLEQLGLRSKLAKNGKEAVEAVCKEKFATILMDCQMPEMDGFEATVAIRMLESSTGNYTPIIAVTALAGHGDRERCIAAGMDDYIPKPIDRQLLKAKLNHWLGRDVAYHQRKAARKSLRPHSDLTVVEIPVNLAELVECYGEDQMNEIIQAFIQNTQDMLKKIASALEKQDSRSICACTHELRAAADSVGAKQLSNVSLCLAQAASQDDWFEAEQTLASLSHLFQKCRNFILSVTWSKMPKRVTPNTVS